MLLDEISHNLHQQGHEVRMLLQLGNPLITGKQHKPYTHKHTRAAQVVNMGKGNMHIAEAANFSGEGGLLAEDLRGKGTWHGMGSDMQ